ncbi:MAG: glycosyltransferase family 4 protein [Actinomycetota bacterium]|nr:glycosyltransferase family 4 protein [Actinomycetota bacterium]
MGFLVPRYGLEIIGGAEFGARMLAEHLAADGCQVEVFTSRGVEAKTWADSYPEGAVEINGVNVHRFSAGPRHPDFDELSHPVLADPARTSMAVADHWIDLQGPVMPGALDAAEACDADVIVAYPYLYWPTVAGVRRLGRRIVLQAAAHDEPPIRLPVFVDVFANNGGMVFQTDAERRLVERLFPASLTTPQTIIGLGVETGPGDPSVARAALGIGDRPYLVCVGRVDQHKGTTILAEWWAAYKHRRPGPLALVYAGPIADPPPPHPDLIVAGPVDEEVKWGALRGATALVQPSPFEAFSLVLVEGWSVGTPALVNAFCGPTAEHCALSGGGVAFKGYAMFEAAVDALVADPALGARLGANGTAYVDQRFRWPALTTRYRTFLQTVADRRTLACP